jgi:hypothetical protein
MSDNVPYDSRPDTLQHIEQVRIFLARVIDDLMSRAIYHDASKLKSPEKEAFDEFTPKLKTSTYGSEEYKGYIQAMGEALKHTTTIIQNTTREVFRECPWFSYWRCSVTGKLPPFATLMAI